VRRSERVPRKRAPGISAAPVPLPAVLFDLDGTLIDSNYQHVIAWAEALRGAGIVIPTWKIHRRIGMSGKSFVRELLREIAQTPKGIDVEQLGRKHDRIFRRHIRALEPLPGANQLLQHLSRHRVQIAIATAVSRQPRCCGN
jgi:beta-phosphoglucomutase-like phosphatase (HAD superfamily)